jgi:hypothetical protein
MKNRIKSMVATAKNRAVSMLRSNTGDAGTNFLIIVVISVVLGAIVLGLASGAIQDWWTQVTARVSEMFATR